MLIRRAVTQQVALNDIAPAHGLGTVNSLMWSLTSALRAILPMSANSLFAYSVKKQLLQGQLVYVIMAVAGLLHAGLMRSKAHKYQRPQTD